MLNLRRMKRNPELIDKLIRIRLKNKQLQLTTDLIAKYTNEYYENEVFHEVKTKEDAEDFIVALDLDSLEFFTHNRGGCDKARQLRKCLTNSHWTQNSAKLIQCLNLGRYTQCTCHVRGSYMPTLKKWAQNAYRGTTQTDDRII